MLWNNLDDLRASLRGVIDIEAGGVTVRDERALRGALADRLAYNAVFADDSIKAAARWIIRHAAQAAGVVPSSIQGLYDAVGRGEVSGFTVPAINIRTLAYDTARAVARAALRHDAGAVVFELARSEIGYTQQRPAEYASVVLAALLREGWRGPAFLQGDHYQFNAKKFAADPAAETRAIEELCAEAIAAGTFNIDIDSSTLVVLERQTLADQQRDNFDRCAHMTRFIRRREPAGVTVSVGGEIGEVGLKNSTVEEFAAYMDGYRARLAELGGGDAKGISKISVQTGTSHGGVPTADGKVAEVKLDFSVLEKIGAVARERYGLAGAVQHGASTLPEDAFDRFPRARAAEIHLATGFQNLVYEHPALPADLRERIYAWLDVNAADEKKPGQTIEQFRYKARKKALGPFKRELWDMPRASLDAIGADLEKKFELLFGKLGVSGSRAAVHAHVKPVVVTAPPPPGLGGAGASGRDRFDAEIASLGENSD